MPNKAQVYEQQVPTTVARGKVKEKRIDIIHEIKYYGIPLVSIGLFIGLLLFAVFPSINAINEKRATIKIRQSQVAQLDTTLSQYEALKNREAQMDDDLELIDKIVPSSVSKVAEFVGEINNQASSDTLTFSETQSGEKRTGVTEEGQAIIENQGKETADIISIPTIFGLKGTDENIRAFLTNLYDRQEFLIIDSLEVEGQKQREFEQRIANEEGRDYKPEYKGLTVFDWTIDVTFGKYQFSKDFSQALEDKTVPLDQMEDQLTIKLIRAKHI